MSIVSSLTDTIPGASLFENLAASFAAAFLPESRDLAASGGSSEYECKADCGGGFRGKLCSKLCEIRAPTQMYGSGESKDECDAECRRENSKWNPKRGVCLAACSTGRMFKATSDLSGSGDALDASTQSDGMAGTVIGSNLLLMLLFIASVILAGVFSYRFNTILGKADMLARADPKVLKMCADLMVPTWLFTMTPFVNIGLAAGLSMSVAKLESSLKA